MKCAKKWWLTLVLGIMMLMGAGCGSENKVEEENFSAETESEHVGAQEQNVSVSNESLQEENEQMQNTQPQQEQDAQSQAMQGREEQNEQVQGEQMKKEQIEEQRKEEARKEEERKAEEARKEKEARQREEQQKKQAELEALKAAFVDIEAVTVYTTTNVNVRMAPSTEAEIWQLAKRGTIFEKNGESEGWSRVVADGEQYYIKSEYLREKRQPGEGSPMIAIDAGHQARGNSEKEPIGPGATEMKAKVTGGTRGTTTGLYEYELTLMVSEKLRSELENRGYTVYMVRESHDVNISNSERAQMAYDSGAEIFIRIHANGSENSSVNGAMTICPTPQNPYVADLYSDSQKLSTLVLDGLTASTGCRRERVWETDTMSGINWSQIPVTIVEMGYMTNPEEDQKMATEEYQQQIAAGIADGVDWYFSD